MLKSSGPMGIGSQYEHLRRLRIRMPQGMFIMANPSHVQKLVVVLSLQDAKTKPMPVPLDYEKNQETPEAQVLLEGAEASTYRTATGILIYVALDRPDVQHGVRLATQQMKSPTVGGMRLVKHIVKYMKDKDDYGVFIPREGRLDFVVVTTDSDWAACRTTRRSVSSCFISIGGATLYSFSRTQSVQAQSSGEAEFYAVASGTSEGLLLREVLLFFGIQKSHGGPQLRLRMDSSAARGICLRQGVGKVRHLAVKTLWVQDLCKRSLARVFSVKSDENGADLGTKALEGPRVKYLMKLIGFHRRAELQEVVTAPPAYDEGRDELHVQGVQQQSARGAKAFLLALASLIGKATGAGHECQQLEEQPRDDSSFFKVVMILAVLMVFVLGMVAGMAVMYYFGKDERDYRPLAGDSTASSSSATFISSRRTRSVAVQSQTSYTKSLQRQQQRFLPLAEESAGVFVE